MSAIVINNLFKNYGAVPALKGLSLKVRRGECVGLLGPNGAGKSTTIQILTGLLQPSSGSVDILGVNPSKDPKAAHSFISCIPDRQTLYDEITVEQNIDLFRRIYKKPPSHTREIIHKMGLDEKARSKAKTLSKGLRQRVLIGRALVHNPEVIFLDEPTSGLDPEATDFVCSILEDLKKRGVTMLLSSHLMYLAERLCDRIALINKGEKKEEGTPAALRKKQGGSQIEVKYLDAGRQKTTLIPLDVDFIEQLKKIQKKGEILSINTYQPKLEDIFIRLVRGERQQPKKREREEQPENQPLKKQKET